MTDEKKDGENIQKEDFTMEELAKIIPDKHHRESLLHLLGHLTADRAAMIA